MPPPTEQTSGYYRDGYRGYLLLMFILVLSITVLVMFNASDNWAAIISCLVCLIMLGVRLAYAQYLWRQTQRARQLALSTSRLHASDSYYAVQNNMLADHLRQPDDGFAIGEYLVAVEEERQRQQVYTISLRHDPPPTYDSVTKTSARSIRAGDIAGIHPSSSNNSQNSIQSGRSRHDTAISRTSANSASSNSVTGDTNLSEHGGRMAENLESVAAQIEVQGMDDSQLPPSYDEALAARLYQQLGLENR